MRGSRRDIPRTDAHWIDNEKLKIDWVYWEGRFETTFRDEFRKKIKRRLSLLQTGFPAHMNESNVSASDMKKKLTRLMKRMEKGKSNDDLIAWDFVYKHTLDYMSWTKLERVTWVANEMSEDPDGFSLAAKKPDNKCCCIIYKLFKTAGAKVTLTSGDTRSGKSGTDRLKPTAIEEFLLKYVYWKKDPSGYNYSDATRVSKVLERSFRTLSPNSS